MSSSWEIKKVPKFGKLTKDIEADVCIVGGGMAGVWCAYTLAKAGKKVVLLEKDRLGRSATLYTTAFLTQTLDTSLSELATIFGRPTAKAIWESQAEAVDRVESAVEQEKIDCDFERLPLAMLARGKRDFEALEEEQKFAKSLGFSTKLSDKPISGIQSVGALNVPDQAKFHPMKFLFGLVEAAEKRGAMFYEHTEVTKIAGTKMITVKTKGGQTVAAGSVITATYQPFDNPKPVHFKKGMYMSYVYALRAQHGAVPEGLYVDINNPYHYLRVDRENARFDRLIVGGEDHRAELTKVMEKKSFKALREHIDKLLPGLKYTVEDKWRGGILESSDGLALIGEYAPNRYLASAFSGNGMTYSAIAGRLISDLILGKKNAFTKLYDPKRTLSKKALAYKARDYGEEFFGGAGKNLFA